MERLIELNWGIFTLINLLFPRKLGWEFIYTNQEKRGEGGEKVFSGDVPFRAVGLMPFVTSSAIASSTIAVVRNLRL
ncbi:MAG: hypothetical protein ACFFAJ_09720 [Candidatus Hodarchaeota archaeon]